MIRTAAATIAIVLAVASIDARQTRDAGTAVLAGTIVTDDGKPARRATVRLSGSDMPAVRIGVTDDAGRFSFARLSAGSFTIVATRPGYVSTYYGSKRPGRGPSLPIALSAGQRLAVSMTMLRGGAISGIITNQFGRPAPQVTVQATMLGVPAPPRLVETTPTFATTDDRGMFRIFGLAPGDYVVSAIPRAGTAGDARATTDDEVRWALQQAGMGARANAGAPAGTAAPPAGRTMVYSHVYFPGTTEPDRATKITLGAGEDHGGVTFALQFVPTAKIDGTVLGPGGFLRPSDAIIMLLPKSTGSAPTLERMIESGLTALPRRPVSQDGRFSLTGVAPGQYTVVVQGSLAAQRDSGRGAASLWGETDITVNGQDLSDVVVALQPGAKLTGTMLFDGASLTAPTDVSVVRLSMSSLKLGGAAMGTQTANVTTNGAFVFPSLLSGPYMFQATSPPAAAGAPRWTLKSIVAGTRDITDGPLEVRTGEDVSGVVITFTDKETEISGTLSDAAGRPTQEFSIVVFTTNRAFWTAGSRRVKSVRPATNGSFRIAGLPAGDYAIVAVSDLEAALLSDPGYLEQLQPVAFRITLAEGEKKKQDLRVGGGE